MKIKLSELKQIIKSVIKEEKEKTKKNLFESSLSRIWQHIENGDTFGVVSAYKSELSEVENKQRHKELASDIRSMGYGFIEQKSVYTYFDDEEGVPMEEKSYFIPKISLKDILTLGANYEQESIIFKDDSKFALIDVNNKSTLMNFAKGGRGDSLTFDENVLKYANSQLVKSNKNSRKSFAFKGKDDDIVMDSLQEHIIPSKTQIMIEAANKRKVHSKWIKIA